MRDVAEAQRVRGPLTYYHPAPAGTDCADTLRYAVPRVLVRFDAPLRRCYACESIGAELCRQSALIVKGTEHADEY